VGVANKTKESLLRTDLVGRTTKASSATDTHIIFNKEIRNFDLLELINEYLDFHGKKDRKNTSLLKEIKEEAESTDSGEVKI